MPRKSKEKERRHLAEIKPMLSEWWNEAFHTVPASGALRWGDTNDHWTYSDIVPPQSFPFAIEGKFYDQDGLIDEVMRKATCDSFIGWWWYHGVIPDAERATKELKIHIAPMVIYKLNRKPNRMILHATMFQKLPFNLQMKIRHIIVHLPEELPFAIIDFKDFLEHVSRSAFELYILKRTASVQPV